MKHTLLTLFICTMPLVASASPLMEVTSEASYHAHRDTRSLDHLALKLGVSVSGARMGVWGHYENLRLSEAEPDRATKHYGELNGIYRFDHVAVHVGGGIGTDYRLRPSDVMYTDLQIPVGDGKLTSYLGYARSRYKARSEAISPNVYQFYRAGFILPLAARWDFDGRLEAIENHDEARSFRKTGPGGAVSLRYRARPFGIEAGLVASCLSETGSCAGDTRDLYLEERIGVEWRLLEELALNFRLTRLEATERSHIVAMGVVRAF